MITPPRIPQAGERVTERIFRDIISYIKAITPKAGAGVTIAQGPNGTTINARPVTNESASVTESASLGPFSVRRHMKTEDDGEESGQARNEIYLPTGSMTTDGDCVPLNRVSTSIGGHEDDGDGWYDLGDDPQEATGEYYVFVFVMPGNHMIACLRAVTGTEENQYDRGCVTSFVVAKVIKAEEGEGQDKKTVWRIRQIHTGARIYPLGDHHDATLPFALKYRLIDDGNGGKVVDGVYCLHRTFSAGGLVLDLGEPSIPEGDSPDSDDNKDATSATTEIWLEIDHSGDAGSGDDGDDPAGNFAIDIKKNPPETTSDDDTTWIKLFDMDSFYPTGDYRDGLKNIPFYR